MEPIRGGYYLKARCIQNADIAKAPPHVREIWDWILKECNHKDTPVCKRGQCVRSYSDIIEGLAWYVGYRKMVYKKHHCEKAMKYLKKATMVTTTKTTRGIIITVLNYKRYQDPASYESYTKATTKATMKLQPVATINKNDKNENNEKNEIKKNIYAETKFDEWWKMYDYKDAKQATKKKFLKLKKKELVDIMEFTPEYVACTPDKNYRKSPNNFLVERIWENDMDIYRGRFNKNKNIGKGMDEYTDQLTRALELEDERDAANGSC